MRWEVVKQFPEFRGLQEKKVLDVGTGLGYFSVKFSGLGAEVLGIDVDKPSLDFLSETYGLSTRYLDAEKDQFPDKDFDLIFIGEVLEHVEEPFRLLKKAKASLRSGGDVLISTPALEGPLIHSKGKSLCHSQGSEKHERKGFYFQELKSYLDQLGLEMVRHKYCIYLLSELFMQMTKLAYAAKKKEYKGQSDILDSTSSVPYKVLKLFYPVILLFFRAEQHLCNSIHLKGHCHVILARKLS
jgi:SAM-dependent methyltransferase